MACDNCAKLRAEVERLEAREKALWEALNGDAWLEHWSNRDNPPA